MERLGDDAHAILRSAGASEIGAIAEVAAVWPTVVGAAAAAQAWPRRLARDGTLLVATSSSTWAFELDRLAPTILARLREALGEAAPPALRFAVGPIPEPPAATAPPRPQPNPPTAEELAEAARLTSEIESPELRASAARAAAMVLARHRDNQRI